MYVSWSPEYDLTVDVPYNDPIEGERTIRVTLKADLLVAAFAESAEGTRFFMQKVTQNLRQSASKHLGKVSLEGLSSLREAMQTGRGPLQVVTGATEHLGPDVLRLESMLGSRMPIRQVQGALLPVGDPGKR